MEWISLEPMLRFVLSLALILLAGCTTLPVDTAVKLRALDYRNDDIASLVLALDLPDTIQPVPEQSLLTFDVTSEANGSRRVRAALALADADELAGTLPPPANHRAYYLFELTDKDKAAIRAAQAFARTLPAGGNRLTVKLVPGLCAMAPANPVTTRLSLLVALPGSDRLAPLLDNETLATVLSGAGLPADQLPACGGTPHRTSDE